MEIKKKSNFIIGLLGVVSLGLFLNICLITESAYASNLNDKVT